MTIVGRLTKDALVKGLKDERQVANFWIAVNDFFKPKNAEGVKTTIYYNCSYWMRPKWAETLKKGTLIEVTGRIYVTAYADSNGHPKASLDCHVNSIKIHAWPNEVEKLGKAAPAPLSEEDPDDLPF